MNNLYHIAVLDFNSYEVKMYTEKLELENENQTEMELVEKFLLENHNLDEIQFMFGHEPIDINEGLPF